MRIITVNGQGVDAKLVPGIADQPTIGPDEVLIKVAAAGVNRADVMQRMGMYPPPPGTSDVIGLEASGTIADVGANATRFAVGDEVCALLAGGGYAEYVAVPAAQVLPIPDGVSLIDAAGLPEVAATVYSNLIMTAGLRSGETLLIHGGASGIGTHAIQLAHALDAKVAVTAGSQRKLDFCANLGADILINYNDDDFVEVMQAQGGANVIFDIMGAKYLQCNVSALAEDGRLVIIGMQGGAEAPLNIGELLGKRGTVAATNLRRRAVDGPTGKGAIMAGVATTTWPLIADGRLKPIIDTTYALDDAQAAHEHLDSGDAIGKVVLTV